MTPNTESLMLSACSQGHGKIHLHILKDAKDMSCIRRSKNGRMCFCILNVLMFSLRPEKEGT